MTPETLRRLANVRTVNLTTVGRQSGNPSTVEIWWFAIDGRFFITGTPGPRDWLANVRANPGVTIEANGETHEGVAREITNNATRREVLSHPDTRWYRSQVELDRLVEEAPMIEIHFTHS